MELCVPPPEPKRRSLAWLPVVLAILGSSCQTNQPMEGRKPIQVEIQSQPSGATAYLVSEVLWRPAGESYYAQSVANGKLDPWFDAYRVTSGVTPVTTSTSMGILHLIVEKDGRFEHREAKPTLTKPDPNTGAYTFTVRLPDSDVR